MLHFASLLLGVDSLFPLSTLSTVYERLPFIYFLLNRIFILNTLLFLSNSSHLTPQSAPKVTFQETKINAFFKRRPWFLLLRAGNSFLFVRLLTLLNTGVGKKEILFTQGSCLSIGAIHFTTRKEFQMWIQQVVMVISIYFPPKIQIYKIKRMVGGK